MIIPSCISKDYSAHDCFETWHHMEICNFFEMCENFEIHLNGFFTSCHHQNQSLWVALC